MKFARKTPVKLLAWLLCLICIVLGTVSTLAFSQLSRYGGYHNDRDTFVSDMQANTLSEDIYQVSQYYSLRMSGLPWTEQLIETYQRSFAQENTNFFFTVTDYDSGETLLDSYTARASTYLRQEFYLSAANYYDYEFYEDYFVSGDGSAYNTAASSSDSYAMDEAELQAATTGEVADSSLRHVIITGYIAQDLTAQDDYASIASIAGQLYEARHQVLVLLAVCVLGLAVGLLVLARGAGRRSGADVIRLGRLSRMPWDLLLVPSGGYAWLLTWLWGLFINAVAADLYTVYSRIIYQGVAALALCGGAVLLALFVSLAARSKEKGWLKNALLYRLGCWFGRVLHHPLRRLWDVLRSLPMIWKTVLFCACAIGVECLCLYWLYWDGAVLPIILFNVVICVVLLACAACNKRLQQGCRAIADGNMDFRVDTRHMFGDFRVQGEALNRIGSGIAVAVEERLKSERFKTELITNVSHDLKTPLTSIVNYVDLLSKLSLPEDARSYVEVLQRQSARLKKLTEDLVEASKASTGNLSVEITPLNLGELVSQVTGEYGDRFEKAGVAPVLQVSEEKITALGDGRYLWRIMDNLFSNVCKYALSGTRVYIDASIQAEHAVIAVKNISRDRLNVSAEELMERFVRGDASRNTEGSGLGLSIARSLADLMGGQLSLTVDGDLFKAEMRLPLA